MKPPAGHDPTILAARPQRAAECTWKVRRLKKRGMRKILAVAVIYFALFAVPLSFAEVSCPLHPGSYCWFNGKVAPSGAQQYTCTCGDKLWV